VRFALASVVALLASSAVIVVLQRVAEGVSHGLPDALLLNGIEALAIVVSLGVNYTLATLWAFRDEPAA
jgi:putative flippase GtrA